MGWPMGGVVLIWHSYIPESFFCGYFILNDQFSECGSWIASNRWSLVYVYLPAVRRCMSRCRIQDTWNTFKISNWQQLYSWSIIINNRRIYSIMICICTHFYGKYSLFMRSFNALLVLKLLYNDGWLHCYGQRIGLKALYLESSVCVCVYMCLCGGEDVENVAPSHQKPNTLLLPRPFRNTGYATGCLFYWVIGPLLLFVIYYSLFQKGLNGLKIFFLIWCFRE